MKSRHPVVVRSVRCLLLLFFLLGFFPLHAAENLSRVPQGRWATVVPRVSEYAPRLPAQARATLAVFEREHPGVDPTDKEFFHRALLRERQKYGADLDVEEAERYGAWLERMENMQKQLVIARGRHVGLAISGKTDEGRSFALVGFEGTQPIYSFTQNAAAAISSAASFVRMNSAFDPIFGSELSGTGLVVNVNDHGEIYEHAEFQWPGGGSRILVKEVPYYTGGDRSHMTHVAGTVGAYGYVASALGMAPRLWIRALIQQSTSHVINYGMSYPGQPNRSVMGTTSLGAKTTNKGLYTWGAASFDQTLWDYPYYQHFYAAGNDGAAGYASLSSDQPVCKNVITVGSVNDVSRTATGDFLSGGGRSSFSSRGPTLDGRIKPDITANGEGLYSPSSLTGYDNKNGTSMATPNASGSSVLLIQYFNRRFPGQFMRASSLKALIINTADDRGNAGPDYEYGWGIMNTLRAAEIIQRYADNPSRRVLVEDALTNGQSYAATYTYNGTGPIRVSLAWTDRPGTYTANNTPVLVNNLELRLVAPNGTTNFPYVMPFTIGSGATPAYSTTLYGSAAVRGTNFTDNVEQVYLASPAAGDYTLVVSHAGTLSGETQRFSLAVSGLTQTNAVPAPVIASVTPAVGTATNFMALTLGGSNFLLGATVTLQRQGLANVQAYAQQVIGNTIAARLDAATMAKGYWDVLVRNPDGQTTTLPSGLLLPVGSDLPPMFTSTPPTTATEGELFEYAISVADADTSVSNLTVEATGLPSWLTFTNNLDGTALLAGTPEAGDIGNTTVTLSLADGAYTTYQVVSLIVIPAGGNTAPVFETAGLPHAHVGVAYSATVTATDADGHALALSISNAPPWLTFSDQGNGSGTLGGTPTAGNTGTVTVAFTATDGLASSTVALPLTVRPRAVVAFSSSTYSVNEGTDQVLITVNRTLNDYNPVSVAYTTVNGTATAGADFTATAGTLSWADGEVGPKTFTVPILNDGATEGNESFTVRLSSLTGVANLGTATGTVTIVDNDFNVAPQVSIIAPSSTIGVPDLSDTLWLSATVTDDGLPAGSLATSWTQVSGPVGATAVFGSAASNQTTVTFPVAGRYLLRCTATDGEFSGLAERAVVAGPIPPPQAGSGITREWFTNIAGTAVINLTTNTKFVANLPDVTSAITNRFEVPGNVVDNYGQRLHGYFIAPQTGDHTFFIASDDASELWLSTNLNPSNKVRIAFLTSFTGNLNWTNYPSQQSAPIPLVAGQAYYIEALHKEAAGNDHVAVGVILPNGTAERPIPANRLSTYFAPAPNDAPQVNPGTVTNAMASIAAQLTGMVVDDGKPAGTVLLTTWSQQSGPGTVEFESPGSPLTLATFSAAGTYTLRLSATDGGATVFQDLTVEVSPLSGFELWLAQFPGLGPLADPTEDVDGDGLATLMEYALGGDPLVGSPALLPAVDQHEGHLTLTYRHNKLATDVTFIVEARGNLGNEPWDSAGLVELSSVDMGDHWRVTVRDAVPIHAAPSRFMRLRVSRP